MKTYPELKVVLSSLSVTELLRLNGAALSELQSRNVVRTTNNPVGDYTEWLVAKALGLILSTNSSSGYDAVSESGVKFQIKARRVTQMNKSRQLGAIRNLAKLEFDVLVAVIFDENFEVIEAVSIPHCVIGDYGVYRPHVNAHIVQLSGAILKDARINNIREQLTIAMAIPN